MATTRQILDRLSQLERAYRPDALPFVIIFYDPPSDRRLDGKIEAERAAGRETIFALPRNGR